MTVIAVDAMGGDNAPAAEVAGAVAAVRGGIRVALVGDRARLEAELAAQGAAGLDGLEVVHASEVVGMDEHPAQAFRGKRDSSMRRAFDRVAGGQAGGVVTAGNSGAALATGLFVLGRLPGIARPAIVTVLPTPTGPLVLCDAGANVEVKPAMLAQFGILGAHYDRVAHGHARPRVGLLSNGAEESKGTALTRDAHRLLAAAAAHPDAGFEFTGYVEGNELFSGRIDVVATDGFTGNVALKLAEGLAEALYKMAEGHLRGAAGLAALRRTVDYREHGGALLGGVDGVVVICHGRSDGRAIEMAIRTAAREVDGGLIDGLRAAFTRHADVWAAEGDASSRE